MTNTFLMNDFYTVESIQADENKILATIVLNQQHAIFKGHFEQMPVVPGVCQTQIIKELLQQTINKNLSLTKGDNIKFTGMIVPNQHPKVQVEIFYKEVENTYQAEAKLFTGNIIFTKFKGGFSLN